LVLPIHMIPENFFNELGTDDTYLVE